MARKNFRGVRFDALTLASFETSTDSGLNDVVTRCRLGEIDAFLSHSWQDDAKLKWSKLNEFKQDFEASNDGIEPRCWLVRSRRFQSPHTPLCTLRIHWRPHTGQGLHRPERGHQREP